MHIETSINSVKVTFDLQRRIISTTDEGKNDPVNDPVKLTELEVSILQIIYRHPDFTYGDIANAISKSIATVKRNIKSLKEHNAITRIGSDKSGYWDVLPDASKLIK